MQCFTETELNILQTKIIPLADVYIVLEAFAPKFGFDHRMYAEFCNFCMEALEIGGHRI